VKPKPIKLIFLFFLFNILFIRCNDQIIETYVANVPVYLSYEDFRNAIKTESPQDIQNPGKIYFYNNLFFINEYLKGIHVIDNSNPSSPQKLSFISIPGNIDIAIKNDILFADSYIDLISLDISDPENIKFVSREKDIFPYILPPYNKEYKMDEIDYEKGIVIDWELKKITQEIEQRTYPVFPQYEGIEFMVNTYSSGNTSYSDNNSSLGVGGSMARFALINNTLFIIDHYMLKIFNIENEDDTGSNILLSNTIYTPWAIETLFPYKNYLFIGSQNGMMIYDISNPIYPEFISDHWHAISCDPVVVEGNYAYITQRSGNACGATENRLDVIDISNIINPIRLKSYVMDEPYGLGIDDSILFVCDGSSGLKIYDVTDKLHITDNLIVQFRDIQAYNAIPFNDILMLIGDDGLYQYDYSDIKDIEQLSTIPVNVK
jgi:hypothetical protein